MPVPVVSIASCVRFFLADVSRVLGMAIPSHAFFVVDATVRVKPDHGIVREVRLRCVFAREELEVCRRRDGA